MVTPGGMGGDGEVSQGEVILTRSGSELDLGTFTEVPSISIKSGGSGFLAHYQQRKFRSAKKEMVGGGMIPSDPTPWGSQFLEGKEDGSEDLLLKAVEDTVYAQKISHEIRE